MPEVTELEPTELWDLWWYGSFESRDRLPNVLRGYWLFVVNPPCWKEPIWQ